MSSSALTPDARQTLRHLTSTQALDFCSRLLNRTINSMLTFPEFHATARELVEEKPEDAALFLAALVALDMGAPDYDDELDKPLRPPMPCRN